MAVTIYDVYNALGLTEDNGTQTLINAIRNSTDLEGITSVFDGSVEGLRDFGVAVNSSNRRQNIFVNELVDRIGIVIINQADLRNPLKRFKKGRMENGRAVQEIHADLIKAQSFNPEDAAQTVFRRNPPNVRVLFHDNWRKELYPNTIERTTLKQAFTSFDKFEEFVVSTYDAVYNSNEVDEYVWTKAMIESYIANGYATYVSVPNVTDQLSATEFVKSTRAVGTKMRLPQGSRMYNAAGVHTRTPKERMWIMIDADLDALLDVDVLARAFNMDKTQIETNKIVVENFAVTGLQAVLFDENILKIYDKEFEMNSIENPKGLYWNTFLHVHQLFSMGKFQNLVAFMSEGIPPIKKLILTPVTSYMTLDTEKVLDGYMELGDGLTANDVDLVVTVTDEGGNTVTGVTTAIDENATSQIKVRVTVTNENLIDQSLTVTLKATEVVEEGDTPFVRTASAIIIPLPKVSG